MDIKDIKRYINNNTIDFTELILNNYYKLGLDETDAVIMIKLQYLLNNNKTFISPKELAGMLSLSTQKTSRRLNSLIEKGFIQMEVVEKKNGKQTESFNFDFLIESIIKTGYEKRNKSKETTNKTLESKLVKLFEEEFKKPLSILDIQTITKWLNEDKYTYEDIKEALFDAVRLRKLTIKYVDSILLRKDDKPSINRYKKTTKISDLKKIWEE